MVVTVMRSTSAGMPIGDMEDIQLMPVGSAEVLSSINNTYSVPEVCLNTILIEEAMFTPYTYKLIALNSMTFPSGAFTCSDIAPDLAYCSFLDHLNNENSLLGALGVLHFDVERVSKAEMQYS